MAPLQLIPAAAVALILTTCSITTAAQEPPMYPMFVLDSGIVPASLDASLVAVNTDTSERGNIVMTFSLDCPAATNSANNACRAKSVYPAEVWHTQGSVWGGTKTFRGADDGVPRTTMWECDLGSGSYGTTTVGPHCVQTVVKKGKEEAVLKMELGDCFIKAHTVPLLVTAGADKLPARWYYTEGLAVWQSVIAEVLASKGCPVQTTAATDGAPATTAGTGGAASTGEPTAGGLAPTTGSTPTQSQPSNTLVAAPSSTSNSALSGAFKEMPFLMVGGAVAMYFAV